MHGKRHPAANAPTGGHPGTFALLGVLLSLPAAAMAQYQVGPGRMYRQLSELPALGPGDVVEVDDLPESERGTYSPFSFLLTEGIFTSPTCGGIGNSVAQGEPVMSRISTPSTLSTSAAASVRLRRRCPRPHESWL